MDCRSASAADCVCDWGEGVQWPNERKPIFFMQDKSTDHPFDSLIVVHPQTLVGCRKVYDVRHHFRRVACRLRTKGTASAVPPRAAATKGFNPCLKNLIWKLIPAGTSEFGPGRCPGLI